MNEHLNCLAVVGSKKDAIVSNIKQEKVMLLTSHELKRRNFADMLSQFYDLKPDVDHHLRHIWTITITI